MICVNGQCLGPTGNQQGGHWFLSLSTGARIRRHQWTELPMPVEVINRVNALGKAQQMPKTLTFADRHAHEIQDTLNEIDSGSNDES